MRINVYSQELTSEVKLISKECDGRDGPTIYHAAQLIVQLHHPPLDDDRSAVTFWIPKSEHRREEMAQAFERIAEIFRSAPLEESDRTRCSASGPQVECVVCQGLGGIELTGATCTTCGGSGWVDVK